jgi:hypothetical protein
MGSRIIVATLLAFGCLSPGTSATPRRHLPPAHQAAVVHFERTTDVAGVLLSAGPYVVVHDAEKMARGEACTTFYRFAANQRREEVVSFHCIPHEREVASETTLTTSTVPCNRAECMSDWYIDKLLEYQFAGDSEGHGVPDRTPVLTSADGPGEMVSRLGGCRAEDRAD